MTITTARTILRSQARELNKIHGIRMVHDGYEYRLSYCNGFAPMVGIDRREVGRRNFKYFGGLMCDKYDNVNVLLEDVQNYIIKRTERR